MPDGRPRFTIVTAVYNVSQYLGDFIRSIDEQAFAPERLEVVAVDDGSTDDSLEVLHSWAARAEYRVVVLHKENGGQGSARNAGLAVATGEWVTFTDPDDMLAPGYLEVVDGYLAQHPEVAMAATNRVYFEESTGALRDGHPLRKMFRTTRSADIDGFPDLFHGSAPSAFLRLDQIRSLGLSFDVRIRPNFEDGHFCSLYMLHASPRIIAFLPEAQYIYRRRGNLSSTLQRSLLDRGRFTDVIEFGYIGAMEYATSLLGFVPEWLQNLILYELSWYFSSEDAPSGALTAAVGEVADEFHALMPRLVQYLDPDVVRGHRVRRYRPVWRDVLLNSWTGNPWRGPYAVADPVDLDTGLVRIIYRYIGDAPREEFLVRGRVVPPRHSKVRPIVYFDRTVMHERIAWVSTRGTLRLRLGGHPVPIRDEWEDFVPLARIFTGEATVDAAEPTQRISRTIAGRLGRDQVEAARLAARQGRREFRGAWVLVDRIHDADDSAEVLFKYLRRNRPDINAWFALEEGTADWRRLEREGLGDRMVAWGSRRWKSLMANCRYLISSHVDVPIHQPPEILEFTEPTWKFVFLQHGIIKDDISNWLNPKELSIFVTSTPAEYASVAGDGTRYVYTTKEAQNTGLPRFDALLEAGRRYPPERRDLVLVAPTWRHWLSPPLAPGSQRREVREGFWESDYAKNWMGLLTSERLRRCVEDRGLRVGFLPHPNLQGILREVELPDHVLPLEFSGDVRSYFARSAALSTDYSSMAFNAAYLDRPVTYFHFDAEQMFGGGHVGRGGYFNYERDGFGPVAYRLEDAIDDLVSVVERGHEPDGLYAARIRATFPVRDGRACERVTAAIEALGTPLSAREQVTPVPTPVAEGS